ncbi:MAG: hypothetical protein WAW96_13960 [Alphaproteobacteria bacterium]
MALLLLRIAAALTLSAACFYVGAITLHPWFATGLVVPAILLFFGFGTRIAALACAIAAVFAGIQVSGWHGAIICLEALNFFAIALLGAGAYSIDARLFGRRVIKLDN